MTQPLNYAAAAVAEISSRIDIYHPEDRPFVQKFIDQIKRSIHFSVPDNGAIFDDNLKGIHGQDIRLPFSEITIEYFVSKVETTPGLVHVPKRLILAREVSVADFIAERTNTSLDETIPKDVTSDKLIIVSSIYDVNDGYGWRLVPGSLCIPCSGWDDYSGRDLHPIIGQKDDGYGTVGFTILELPRLSLDLYNALGRDAAELRKHLCTDTASEAMTVLELCEALTCSNVGMTTIQKVKSNVNERRIRNGKLPLYEVKALEIIPSVSAPHREVMYGDGVRNGPRQHLRRGHIRRLPDRNIWISSCVVGNQGQIDKSYIVNVN